MSRIGNAPVALPKNVEVNITDGGRFDYKHLSVKGPKGELSLDMRSPINIEVSDGEIIFSRPNDQINTKSLHGLYRSLTANMVEGVVNGYERDLEIIGIGYRAELQGNVLVLSLGFAHKIELDIPEGIEIEVDDQTKIKIKGIDKELVGQIAATIRGFRPPEPYKGKGVRYKGEQVRRKSVKQG